MDFRFPNSGHHHSASHQQQPPSATPSNFSYQLNPAVPGFEPVGAEMQRYQQYPLTPPSSSMSTPRDMTQIRNYVLNSHFAHTKEITGLQRESQKTLDEIEGIKDTVRRDMQTLQAKITALEGKVGTNECFDLSLSQRSRIRPGLGQVSEDFNQENIAELYLEEAETMEATATKLREQAVQMSGRDITQQLVTMKLIEGPQDMADQAETKTEFACCGNSFATVQELLEHVRFKHGSSMEQPVVVRDVNNETTPTHFRARRQKPSEIAHFNTAVSAEEEKLRAEIAEIKEELAKKDLQELKDILEKAAKMDCTIAIDMPATNKEHWMPLAVRQMPTPSPLAIEKNIETFTWGFLNSTFRGDQWSPGYYFISKNSALPSKSYWVLDAEYEPYLPKVPGQHGAKLTAFFNMTDSAHGEAPEEINYINVPVFICPEGKKQYVYYGNFSQKRFSDKLDYDHVTGTVPTKVRKYWAEQLADLGRPEWVTQALIEHFWPKPNYCGRIPTDSAVATPATAATPATNMSEALEKRVIAALHEYADELKEWKKETEMKVRHITVDNLMEAFGKPDADTEPGLRLWWEYMEFVKYDQEFYEFMVQMKNMKKPQNSTSTRAPLAQRSKTVQTTSDEETVVPASPPKLSKSKQTTKVSNWSTGTKTHLSSGKPSEQMSTAATASSRAMVGDVEAAKAFQVGAKKNFAPGAGRTGDGSKLPPHMRRGK